MSLKKLKIITLIIGYFVFLLLLFSETFISDFQEVRRNLIINSENEAEILYIPIKQWQKITDKKEFNYNGNYYDSKSVSYQKGWAKVEVLQDELEHTIKFFSKQIHSKNKKNHSLSGKKNIVLYYYPSQVKTKTIKSAARNHFRDYTNFYKPNYSLFLFRPPTSI